MIQTVIIAIPGLVALIECIRRGPERALLNVYLPVLLLLPEYPWQISGQYSFADTAIVPIAVFLLFQSKLKWRWNSIDFLVIGYLAITALAEGMNKGYKLGAQNLAIQDFCRVFLPYLVAKNLFRHPQFAVDAAKRVSMLLAFVAIVSVYEFRMGSDLFTRSLQGIFPSTANTTLFRAGFMRTQGPYGHAITLGIMMAIGFRIVRWLEWSGEWKGKIRFLQLGGNGRTLIVQISKIRFCEFWIVVGSIMSLSVGPWLAAGCGAIIVGVCRAHKRKRAMALLVLFIALSSVPSYTAFKHYISVDPGTAEASGDRLQADAAYRNMLVPVYIPVVEERPDWGWGKNEFPVYEGLTSIDNCYLAVALMFGLYALAMLVLLFVWPPIRLVIFSLPLDQRDPRALAAFSMIGIYVLNIVVDGTAAGGGTPWRLLFIVAGWTAALLTQTPSEIGEAPPEITEIENARSWPRTQVGFRRVMV